MDLDGVRTFVAAADCGQFQAAADEIDLTQQGVSRRIAALEKSLGVRLFVRNARGVTLTADGQPDRGQRRHLGRPRVQHPDRDQGERSEAEPGPVRAHRVRRPQPPERPAE